MAAKKLLAMNVKSDTNEIRLTPIRHGPNKVALVATFRPNIVIECSLQLRDVVHSYDAEQRETKDESP